MTHGTVNWFQIDTDDTTATEKFYGDLFGWTFVNDPNSPDYRLAILPGSDRPQGGILDTQGRLPNRATYFVQVSDVATAIEQTERRGGKVTTPTVTTPNGLAFAHLQDPAGNVFGVYSPPAN